MKIRSCMTLAGGVSFLALGTVAHAQGDKTLDELDPNVIVVTAQKRSESANTVPISITALSGDALADRGVTNTADLVKVVPGFTVTQTNSQSPVYTLRGVGLYLYDSGIGASPAVSVYVDEISIPTPLSVTATSLDLERVEVLKGPQGTLFGQNATGGAINYVAAKPTDYATMGGSFTYSRFDKIEASVYASGPVSETLSARVAGRSAYGGAWQQSVSRPGDKLGTTRELQGRVLLDWHPSDRVKFMLNGTIASNKSDTIAGQFLVANPAVPPLAFPGLVGTPPVNQNARAADWTPGLPYRADDSFALISLRGDFELSDSVTVTSQTSYQHIKTDRLVDQDGTALHILDINPYGSAKNFDQELRVSGESGKLNWVIGGNYGHSKLSNNLYYRTTHLSFNGVFSGPPFFIPPYNQTLSTNDGTVETYAVFGNLEYELSPNLTVQGGIRYTNSKRAATSCTSDPETPDLLASFINAYQLVNISVGAKTTPFVPITPNGCVILTPAPDLTPTGPFDINLNENNVAWRTSLNYTTDSGSLLYANVSKGYKSGAIIPAGGLVTTSYLPTKQESLLAYEIGAKMPLADRKIQANVAAFYYDYRDKQVTSTVPDPVFQALPGLSNVPKSRVFGIEGQLTARPIDGLNLNLAATYLETKVTADYLTGVIQQGVVVQVNAKGLSLPNTPKFSATADAQYEWSVGAEVNAFVGSGLTHVSRTTANFPSNGIEIALPGYTLLDARVGVSAKDDSWRFTIWGRNITDEYYVISDNNSVDVRYRYAGMPVTYGATLSFKIE